jgi:hypothetical protein
VEDAFLQQLIIDPEAVYRQEEEANNNAYLILTGKKTFEQILNECKDGETVYVPEDRDNIDVFALIKYYESIEWYERCQELLDHV